MWLMCELLWVSSVIICVICVVICVSVFKFWVRLICIVSRYEWLVRKLNIFSDLSKLRMLFFCVMISW